MYTSLLHLEYVHIFTPFGRSVLKTDKLGGHLNGKTLINELTSCKHCSTIYKHCLTKDNYQKKIS